MDGKSVKYMLEYIGCDVVMIGRVFFGNLWIFREINVYLNGEEVFVCIYEEVKILMIRYFDDLIKFKGEYIVCLEMCLYGFWYLKGLLKVS